MGEVVEAGVDGEKDLIMKHSVYHVVIILAGTNDIGSNIPTKNITNAFDELFGIVSNKYNAKCIAVTIPPYQKNNVHADLEQKKNEINKYIKTHHIVHSVCDLYKYIEALDDKQRAEFYDDFLHFTESGYEQFGELVFNTMHPLLFHLSGL